MRICKVSGCGKPVFGTDKVTKIGYCKLHQGKRTDIKKYISKQSTKKIESKVRSFKPSEINHPLLNWFEDKIKIVDTNPMCWNCGKFIPKSFYRAACAHILPKRKTYGFPSVATHELNFLILGPGCGCHAKFDTSWDDASKMKVWPMAVERFKKIYPEINKEEHKNIPKILLDQVEP